MTKVLSRYLESVASKYECDSASDVELKEEFVCDPDDDPLVPSSESV